MSIHLATSRTLEKDPMPTNSLQSMRLVRLSRSYSCTCPILTTLRSKTITTLIKATTRMVHLFFKILLTSKNQVWPTMDYNSRTASAQTKDTQELIPQMEQPRGVSFKTTSTCSGVLIWFLSLNVYLQLVRSNQFIRITSGCSK